MHQERDAIPETEFNRDYVERAREELRRTGKLTYRITIELSGLALRYSAGMVAKEEYERLTSNGYKGFLKILLEKDPNGKPCGD